MNTETDILEMAGEKRFLGRDFLTWLWFKAEERGGAVLVSGIGDVLVRFERFMVLEEGEAEASESLTCRGLQTELVEARAGLRAGKKVSRAHIRLGAGDDEWSVTLDGTTLDFRSLRVRQDTRPEKEAGGDPGIEARILERAFLLERAVEVVDRLFRIFLTVRTEPEAWKDEAVRIRGWISTG